MSSRAEMKTFSCIFLNLYYTIRHLPVCVELVDEEDSKSFGANPRAGGFPPPAFQKLLRCVMLRSNFFGV